MNKFPFEEQLMQMKLHEEDVIWINGKAFLVRPATDNDVERIGKGYFCMD